MKTERQRRAAMYDVYQAISPGPIDAPKYWQWAEKNGLLPIPKRGCGAEWAKKLKAAKARAKS